MALGLCMILPQGASGQGTSTPEERMRWVEITHKLESSPLDESVNKDGEWALNRLSDAHDIHVPLCPALLGEFNDAKYKYRHEITRQYMLASGAFLIENPDKSGDVAAMNLAAVESVLKVYSAILQQIVSISPLNNNACYLTRRTPYPPPLNACPARQPAICPTTIHLL